MAEEQKKEPRISTISSTFKLWLVAIIFFLTFFHLYAIYNYPQARIISNEVLLGLVLTLVGYLWIQELRDRERLQAINLALIKAQRQLEHAEIDTIAALILAEEAKDPYVRGHSKRVTRCAVELAQELGFSQEQRKTIERAGILHDIGKIGISDAILRKPDKLNEEEWTVIKKHPRRAAEILEPLRFLTKEKEMICHHHERFDGKGYPDGLKAEEIPLGARILAVVDTFDAMNSERPYRKSLAEDAITSELKSACGNQLDPGVVSAFLGLLKKKPSLWEREG
ncbi:MAG: HD-GYP domain-containing protein [Candidatus Omnitrophica bacterium]|nr:HD-GYP domain-containing protein [Candidatus Omnitrophota bacterium]